MKDLKSEGKIFITLLKYLWWHLLRVCFIKLLKFPFLPLIRNFIVISGEKWLQCQFTMWSPQAVATESDPACIYFWANPIWCSHWQKHSHFSWIINQPERGSCWGDETITSNKFITALETWAHGCMPAATSQLAVCIHQPKPLFLFIYWGKRSNFTYLCVAKSIWTSRIISYLKRKIRISCF